MNVTKFMYVIGIGCLCIYRRKKCRLPAACSNIFKILIFGEMFTYKSIRSPMVIYMVTDIKQTCLGQGLGVTFTARKHPSKLMYTMKDLGHTLPGLQN